MPTVKFVHEKKTVEVPAGANLRKEARKAGVEIYSGMHRTLNCMGLGQCASCAVRIAKGCENVSPPGLWERIRTLLGPFIFLRRMSHEPGEVRLACRTEVRGDVEVETHPEINWHGDRFWG